MDTGTTISRARACLRALARARLLAMVLVAAGLQCPGASLAECHFQSLELPVKIVGHRAIATVGIGGNQVPLLVDTGVYFSMLTYAAASQLKLEVIPLPQGFEVNGPPDQIDAGVTTVPSLQLLDGGEMNNIDFVVDSNEPAAGAMGVLGRNFLALADTEYDLAHGVIRLMFPGEACKTANMAYWAAPGTAVSQLALARESGTPTHEIRSTIELNGHQAVAVFDSGARTLVSLDAALRAGVARSGMTPDGRALGLGVGSAKQWTATFDKVDVGGEAIEHNPFEVVDFDLSEDMRIGIDFFLSHRLYVSQQQSRMFFTYNGGPVFALDHGELGDRDPNGPSIDSLSPEDLVHRASAALSRAGLEDLARHFAAAGSGSDWGGALADLDRACALLPANADLFTVRALLHAEQQHPNLALADLDTALRLDPTHAFARLVRANVYAAQGERDKALEGLAALDKRLAPQSEGRRTLATQYDELAMPAQSLAQWNLWIANHPSAPHADSAYNGRCWVRVELGIELDKALDDCDKAVEADASDASFLDSRAWAYLRMGAPRKALADFDRGLAIRPAGAFSLYGRGLVHLALGEASASQADLAAARKARPDVDDMIRKAGLPLAPAP